MAVMSNLHRLGRKSLTIAMVLFIVYLVLDAIAQIIQAIDGMGMANEHGPVEHYGQWPIVVGSIVILSFFTLAYVVPVGKRNWRSAGLVQGFIIALFTEMYGFPLTVYALASLIGRPIIDPGHTDGHLLARAIASAFGLDAFSTAAAVMAVSSTAMAVGFFMILSSWERIYRAHGQMVTDGFYRHLRHPQYTGILLVTLALLVHWPTLVTIVMWPVLVYTYYGLARREERVAVDTFGEEYRLYRQKTPMFIPRP